MFNTRIQHRATEAKRRTIYHLFYTLYFVAFNSVALRRNKTWSDHHNIVLRSLSVTGPGV